MPIFRFAAVTGAILLVLLFVADATLAPRGPLFTNNSEGLPRSQPIRQQEAELPPEPPRPRAPMLVPDESPPAIAEPMTAATPAAAPLAPVAETAGTTQPVEAAKTEPASTPTTKLETARPGATEAASSVAPESHAATAETVKPTPTPKTRKQARRSERGSRYAAYGDDVPRVENGYPYGVPFRRERQGWQRPWSAEFGEGRYRF